MDYTITAQCAIEQYDIQAVSVYPVAQSGAAVFKVEDRLGNRYSLRVHDSKISTLEVMWTSPEALDSELVWLDALHRDTGLILPRPIRNKEGAFVTQAGDLYCTMLGWVEGEQKSLFTSELELKAAAEMTAALHRHASQWQPPASFTRPTVDAKRIGTALDLLKQQAREGMLDALDVRVLEAAGRRAMSMLDNLPRDRMTWGLLHGDIVPPNIVFADGAANPIDFGACVFGPYLTDVAITFFYVHPSARRQYLDWYGSHFPLPEAYVDIVEGAFIAMRLIVMRNALGMPGADNWLPADVRKSAAREFGSYAAGERFLFTGTPFWE